SGEWERTGAVTGSVDSGPGGAGRAVDDDVSGVADAHTGLRQTEVLGVRNRTAGHETVGALDATSGGQHLLDAVLRAGHGCGTGTGEDVHALVAEHEFEHIGGV